MSVAKKQASSDRSDPASKNRVSKADLRVEAYGTIDELNSALGFARSICANSLAGAAVRDIQETVFRVAPALATPREGGKALRPLSAEDVNRLPEMEHAIRANGGVLPDWSLSGAHTEAAAFEMARAVCRRAERCLVRLAESGEEVNVHAVPYISRLSDMIWLFARQVELDARMEVRLRTEKKEGAS